MIILTRKHISILVGFVLLVVSVIGMLIIKEKLEYRESSLLELYFSLFRILFVGILAFFTLERGFKRWKEYQQLKNEKAIAELSNLKKQVSPHFFFNTLNNLYALIKKDSDAAREFVLKLSDLMRYSIYGTDRETVPLKEEVSYIDNFISLQEMRRFSSVNINFQKDIHDENVSISPLLLIILVENAFKHGAEKLIEDAFITLILKTTTDKLLFSVENNFEKDHSNTNEGLGLRNLQKRLQLQYPNKHSFTIHSDDTIFKAVLELVL
ncbi:histidine kinase [Aquimarina sp. D1M17]|uniref:sensor histidine kinase n=1 Tax=Aquimarina acroporae TaxID=2937283 RepID=UPI0020BDD7AF|nr:histidine kinase [Aquimarina acroporae]MCK8520145.1 histidine kinase [Aquimarina acroporae]